MSISESAAFSITADIVRDMFVADSMADVAAVVRALRSFEGVVIVRVKDRFTTPSAGGWRD